MITVLLVDDEAYLREMIHDMLGMVGLGDIEVIEAEDGLTAIEAITKRPITLCITDIRMPNLGGAALARHIRDRHPEIRILMMTGYTTDALDRQDIPLLHKPFGLKAFEAAVREALSA